MTMTQHTITDLEPTLLWKWFDTICSIPHGSYNEERLAEYIVDWASASGLWVERDGVGNILIKKPATHGMQQHQTVALQAHLDMVTQANHDYDFKANGIRPVIAGEWVKADGTTLGADNGIGMASCLAVLESDLPHPDIEVLLTMTEEVGMEGVFGLQAGWLTAPIMINTDTEEVGEIYLGCAGGIDGDFGLVLDKEPTTKTALRLDIKGLRGGHSGLDIDKNNSNAIKLLARMMAAVVDDVQICVMSAGTARNAIPRSGYVIMVCDDVAGVQDRLHKIGDTLKTEIAGFEHLFEYAITEVCTDFAISTAQTKQIIHFLNALPNGVVRYSDTAEDTVETSLSSGVLRLGTNDKKGDNTQKFSLTTLVRSLVDSGKQGVVDSLSSLATLADIEADFFGSYVGWNPDVHSKITALTQEVYAEILGYEPKLKVIHAGLECGLIKKAYPNMDMVSIGPTIKNAHSPDECVHIKSVAVYWQLLTDVLARIPKRS